MDFHFISGLPRSGSTLLASILSQNPKFDAGICSPVAYAFNALHRGLSNENEAANFLSDGHRAQMLKGLFTGYYGKSDTVETVFDNNRRWCNKLPVLSAIFPKCRVICCVRPLAWIADSVERLVRSHPLSLSKIFNYEHNSNVYGRSVQLIQPDALIGFAYAALRDAYYGPHNNRLLFIEYDALCQHPDRVTTIIHDFLELPQFEYDFDHVRLPNPAAVAEFDARLGTPGLHEIREVVQHQTRQSILPPDVFASFPEPFWREENSPVPTLRC